MRNIWEIFKRDALRIRTNVIAIIAIVGINGGSMPLRMVQHRGQLGSL